MNLFGFCFFFSSRRRHTRWPRDWSSDVCSSDLRVAGSSLSANFLVLVPNLTVRDRVRGVDERTGLSTGSGLDPASEENLYTDFVMVPPEYQEEFRPNVVVRTWQGIPLEANRDDWIGKEMLGEGRF